jgi:hypothetical protein
MSIDALLFDLSYVSLNTTGCPLPGRYLLTSMSCDFGFRREVAENCALLGYYTASSGNFFTDVSGQRIGSIRRVQEFKRMSFDSFLGCYTSRRLAFLLKASNTARVR